MFLRQVAVNCINRKLVDSFAKKLQKLVESSAKKYIFQKLVEANAANSIHGRLFSWEACIQLHVFKNII